MFEVLAESWSYSLQEGGVTVPDALAYCRAQEVNPVNSILAGVWNVSRPMCLCVDVKARDVQRAGHLAARVWRDGTHSRAPACTCTWVGVGCHRRCRRR